MMHKKIEEIESVGLAGGCFPLTRAIYLGKRVNRSPSAG
jgi:hypothetical protein